MNGSLLTVAKTRNHGDTKTRRSHGGSSAPQCLRVYSLRDSSCLGVFVVKSFQMQFPEPQAAAPEENVLRFLVFRMAAQDFMVEIHRVQEVLRWRNITPVPAAPSFV